MDGGGGGEEGGRERLRCASSLLSPEVRWVPSLIKLIKAELKGLKAQPEPVWLLGYEVLTLHLSSSQAQLVRSRNLGVDVEQRRRAANQPDADRLKTDLSSTSVRGNTKHGLNWSIRREARL